MKHVDIQQMYRQLNEARRYIDRSIQHADIQTVQYSTQIYRQFNTARRYIDSSMKHVDIYSSIQHALFNAAHRQLDGSEHLSRHYTDIGCIQAYIRLSKFNTHTCMHIQAAIQIAHTMNCYQFFMPDNHDNDIQMQLLLRFSKCYLSGIYS